MKNRRAVLYVNLILVILETVALIHDITVFGAGLFEWYTVDSNVLQLAVSGLIVYYVARDRELPEYVTALHFITAVDLTVTFLIAALVLAPEGGIRYYFIENVAPINHLMAVSLLYGLICLVLNAAGLLEGPYFFLEVGKQPASLIITWFGIIAALCIALAGLYYWIKWRKA